MKTEIEVKFLSQNFDSVREALVAMGAECTQPMRLMRRAIIDFPDRRLQKEVSNSFMNMTNLLPQESLSTGM